MDFHEVLILFVVLTGLFYAVWAKFGQRRFWKPAVIGMLTIWAAAVAIQTVFHRTAQVAVEPIWQPFRSYSDALKVGGDPELLRSNLMNTVLFYPAGLLAAAVLPEKWKAAAAAAVLAAFSAVIELAQYCFGLGLAQTDDVIHNTLGAVLGAAVFLCIPGIIRYIRSAARRISDLISGHDT